MAKVVVTGGAGFIGSHIVDVLVRAGHQVAVIDNLSTGDRKNLAPGVVLHELDIRSREARELLMNLRPELVVHAAAQISVRLSMEDPAFDADVNVVGLVNLLQAFMKAPMPQFIFLSTGGAIYGEQTEFPATESHRIQPTSIYGHAKRVGESYLEFWAREFGLRFCALRLANVYGPRQSPHGEAGVVAIFLKRLFEGKVPVINGSGEQTRDFVYVEDVADAVLRVFEKGVTGTFNIGTARETSVNELYQELTAAAGCSVTAQHAPAKAGEQMRSCIDPTLAKRTFGWSATRSLEEGLTLTAAWFKPGSRA